jgi:hypothetical protein
VTFSPFFSVFKKRKDRKWKICDLMGFHHLLGRREDYRWIACSISVFLGNRSSGRELRFHCTHSQRCLHRPRSLLLSFIGCHLQNNRSRLQGSILHIIFCFLYWISIRVLHVWWYWCLDPLTVALSEMPGCSRCP